MSEIVFDTIMVLCTLCILVGTAAAYPKVFFCLVGAWLLWGAYCEWEDWQRRKQLKKPKN